MTHRVYLSPPDLDGDELARVTAAIESNWVAPLGPEVDGFEEELATWTGQNHAAALSSGTAALHLALLLNGIGPGDKVIVPTMTFAATANAVTYVGAKPVFVDVLPDTANVDPQCLALCLDDWDHARHGEPPRLIIPVDLYGQCCDYDALVPIIERHGLAVIEDAAEALGATWQGRRAGSFANLAVLSFNGNKIITTSGGGALVGADADDIARARYLASQARQPFDHYEHTEIGFNYRMSNVLAAIGRGQLARLDHKITRRRRHRRAYGATLGHLPGVSMLAWDDRGEPNAWLSAIVMDADRHPHGPQRVAAALATGDIEARPLWKPMHLQPVFAANTFIGTGASEQLFATGLCLPSGSSLSDTDRDRVIDIVAAALSQS